MPERLSKFLPWVLLLTCCLAAVYMTLFRPGYLTSAYYMGGFMFLQILIAALWNYRQRFFVLLMLVFFWAGMPLPLSQAWISGRWYVLFIGALTGFIIYMKDQRHHFGTFHLLAFLCVLSALVSAVVSAHPQLALLKVLSLFLLFTYGAAGGRLVSMGKEEKFITGLLVACEILVYITAFSYFILHFDLFDSPNSLGAVMGVIAMPLMLWGVLVSERQVRARRTFALLLTVLLLLASYARAGMVGAVISCGLLCWATRNYRLLVKGAVVVLLGAMLVVTVRPLESAERGFDTKSDSLATIYLYKGRRAGGMFNSRESVWEETLSAIQSNPWFGTGFGTSMTSVETTDKTPTFSSNSQVTREHGNSYLAIAEWAGLLGVVPFYALIFLAAIYAKRVFLWLRTGGNLRAPVIPLAGILAAGLVHAMFEDWLFAVGYYLCIFFWVSAFLLVDMLPAARPELVPLAVQNWRPWAERWQAAVPGR